MTTIFIWSMQPLQPKNWKKSHINKVNYIHNPQRKKKESKQRDGAVLFRKQHCSFVWEIVPFLLRNYGISPTRSVVSLSSKMAYPQSNKSRHLKTTHIQNLLCSPSSHKRAAIVAHCKVIKKIKEKEKPEWFYTIYELT